MEAVELTPPPPRAHRTMVSGPAGSGKSRWAELLAERSGLTVVYLATGPSGPMMATGSNGWSGTAGAVPAAGTAARWQLNWARPWASCSLGNWHWWIPLAPGWPPCSKRMIRNGGSVAQIS